MYSHFFNNFCGSSAKMTDPNLTVAALRKTMAMEREAAAKKERALTAELIQVRELLAMEREAGARVRETLKSVLREKHVATQGVEASDAPPTAPTAPKAAPTAQPAAANPGGPSRGGGAPSPADLPPCKVQ